MSDNIEDEERVARLLARAGLEPRRYKISQCNPDKKNPDFEVVGHDTYFLCEVKSICMGIGDGPVLHSTIFNNLTENIHDAIKQFRAANRIHSVPNVLLWISHNFRVNVRTFLDLACGRILVSTEVVADLSKYRYGRMKVEFTDIDLHIWLESDDTPHFIFNDVRPDLKSRLVRAFQGWTHHAAEQRAAAAAHG
jgi:hypothetical protein